MMIKVDSVKIEAMETCELKLYSLSEAAKKMCIGRDSLRSLILSGKIGYIIVGESKKISHQEILRFQKDNTIHQAAGAETSERPGFDVSKFFDSGKQKASSLNGDIILEKLMRNK